MLHAGSFRHAERWWRTSFCCPKSHCQFCQHSSWLRSVSLVSDFSLLRPFWGKCDCSTHSSYLWAGLCCSEWWLWTILLLEMGTLRPTTNVLRWWIAVSNSRGIWGQNGIVEHGFTSFFVSVYGAESWHSDLPLLKPGGTGGVSTDPAPPRLWQELKWNTFAYKGGIHPKLPKNLLQTGIDFYCSVGIVLLNLMHY